MKPRLQFRLRTLMIVVTLLAINAGLWKAFGSPFCFQWRRIEVDDGPPRWALDGHAESLAGIVATVGVDGFLVLRNDRTQS
jgi:hypothetical protein